MNEKIILISIDCLRADCIEDLETINQMAKEGITFTQCVTPVPFTTSSHATILTGQYPFQHGVRHLYGEKLKPETKMLQHKMKSKGYSTHAIVSCYHMTHIGLANGFQSFWYSPTVKGDSHGRNDFNDAKTVTDRGIRLLEKDKKSFVFLHYFDAHVKAEIEYESMYYSELQKIDSEIKRLKEIFPDATYVITGDHGRKWTDEHNFPFLNKRFEKVNPLECPYEEDGCGHGAELYEEAIRVPLIKWSKDIKPLKVEWQVWTGLIPDLILNEKRAKIKTAPFVYLETFSPDQLFKEGIPLIGIRTPRYKLIVYQTGLDLSTQIREFQIAELYDLTNDPHETKNIIEKKPKIAHFLFENLKDKMAVNPYSDKYNENQTLKRRLAGYGYL